MWYLNVTLTFPDLCRLSYFSHWLGTDYKIWVENSVFAIQHIRNEVLSPSDQTYPFAYSCSFKLHTTYKNSKIGQRGEGCQNTQDQLIIKAHANFVQTCSLISILQ